jgi:hypothetical protein
MEGKERYVIMDKNWTYNDILTKKKIRRRAFDKTFKE